MELRFFNSRLKHQGIGTPDEELRDLQQASIDSVYDVTTAKHTVKEQDGFGKLVFHEIEVWFDYVVGVTSTFMKNGEDFRKLIFQNIDHKCERGLYYKFDNSYWISDFTDPEITLQKFVTVRRCNNWLRIVDPDNGRIVAYPCVIEYDATSPSPQVGSNIITPNNHLTVIVQGNAETCRLFTLNKRFLLGGRPFKLMAFQNALMPKDNTEQPNILYLDLYIDEEHGLDNQELNLAYNGQYDYKVKIQGESRKVLADSFGSLVADVTLNNAEVLKPVLWSSDDKSVVMVNHKGEYRVVGKCGQFATITATLGENPAVTDSITLTVGQPSEVQSNVFFNPVFDKVRQYETIEFEVTAEYNGNTYSGNTLEYSELSLSPNGVALSNPYIHIKPLGNNRYTIEGIKYSKEPISLYCHIRNTEPKFEKTQVFKIMATNMIG